METTLGFSKSEFESTFCRLEQILSTSVETIEVELENPPIVDDLTDSNKSFSINCAILFIDIRKSTDLSDDTIPQNMVKIYRSFMRAVIECVRKNGGVTRQFLGDRIMGVFMDSVNENKETETSAVDKALYSARSMQTIIDYGLNHLIYKHVNEKSINCGIGISYGNLLVTQIGMRGTENDEDKEDEKDVVWVGKTTNYASKYADIAQSGEIFVDDRVYEKLSIELKKEDDNNIWSHIVRNKGDKIYQGYITSNYYLDNIEEFEAEKFKSDKPVEKVDNPFDSLFSSLENKSDELLNRIKTTSLELTKKKSELAVEESKLKERENEIEKDEEKIEYNYKQLYDFYRKIFSETYYKNDLIKELGLDFWLEIIKKIFDIGEIIGKSENEIENDLCNYLKNIYLSFELYENASKYLKLIAKNKDVIFLHKKDYKKIINNVGIGYKITLKTIIKDRISNAINESDKKKFKKHLESINEL
ncbi:MAG: hypothetical protein AWL62_348 [Halanaerobium sp. T82-1]|jgi:class 3 adenylate cyclase|nr:MAG: hypothetical protein AWL62_348 [Halanaerobium sp. T82-1]